MSTPLKLWRNARLATCDAQARLIEDGAILTRGGRIEWVGRESERAKLVELRGDLLLERLRERRVEGVAQAGARG